MIEEPRPGYLVGDIFHFAESGRLDAVVHCCNCFCTMGSGIARQVQQAYRLAFAADKATKAGDRTKLGNYSSAEIRVPGTGHKFTIVNAYAQYGYGNERTHLNYEATRGVFRLIAHRFKGQRIGYPKFGSDRGGGYWPKVYGIIAEELAGLDHTYVEYDG